MDLLKLIRKSEFKSEKKLAKYLNINIANLTHFIAKRYHKIGKAKRKLIRDFFRQQGWLPTPAPRQKCACDKCGRVHIKKVNRSRHGSTQAAERA